MGRWKKIAEREKKAHDFTKENFVKIGQRLAVLEFNQKVHDQDKILKKRGFVLCSNGELPVNGEPVIIVYPHTEAHYECGTYSYTYRIKEEILEKWNPDFSYKHSLIGFKLLCKPCEVKKK